MRYSCTFINLLLASKGALGQKLKKTNPKWHWPACCGAPLSAQPVPCQRHSELSWEIRLCDRRSPSGTAKAVQSLPAGTIRRRERKKTNSASLWKGFSFDLTKVCKWLRGSSCTCFPPKSSETESSSNPTLKLWHLGVHHFWWFWGIWLSLLGSNVEDFFLSFCMLWLNWRIFFFF